MRNRVVCSRPDGIPDREAAPVRRRIPSKVGATLHPHRAGRIWGRTTVSDAKRLTGASANVSGGGGDRRWGPCFLSPASIERMRRRPCETARVLFVRPSGGSDASTSGERTGWTANGWNSILRQFLIQVCFAALSRNKTAVGHRCRFSIRAPSV